MTPPHAADWPDAQAPVDTAQVLARLAVELQVLEVTARRLETAVSRAVGPGRWPAVQPEELEQLQALDLLQQSLADLTRVADTLAKATDHGTVARGPLADACILSDIRNRLLREDRGGDATPPRSVPSGDLTLF